MREKRETEIQKERKVCEGDTFWVIKMECRELRERDNKDSVCVWSVCVSVIVWVIVWVKECEREKRERGYVRMSRKEKNHFARKIIYIL